MARAATAKTKKVTPAKKPAAKPRAKPAAKKVAPKAPPGGIWGDILGLRAGLRPSFEAMLARGVGEERLLAYVFFACLMGFIAGLPAAISIAASMQEENALIGLIAGRFVAGVVFGSLFLYGVAALSHWFSYWGFRGQGSYQSARLALFWALFLAIPLGILKAVLDWVLPMVGMAGILTTIGYALFFFWLWIWTSFLAIAEGFPRGSVFLLLLTIGACLTGLGWLLDAVV